MFAEEEALITPVLRALRQMDDPRFIRVVVLSLLWSLLCFAGLVAGCGWGARRLLADGGGWLGWLAGAAGSAGAVLLALWLFVPVALVIATFYLERIAAAVDARWDPDLPVPRAAPWAAQAWDGLVLGAQVLVLQVLVFGLGFLVPGLGWALGLLLAGWAIGRGLFVAVAMRRMGRGEAQSLYRRRRVLVVAEGVLLAAASAVPLVNLFVPVLGTAVMVHVLNRGLHRSLALPGTERTPARGGL